MGHSPTDTFFCLEFILFIVMCSSTYSLQTVCWHDILIEGASLAKKYHLKQFFAYWASSIWIHLSFLVNLYFVIHVAEAINCTFSCNTWKSLSLYSLPISIKSFILAVNMHLLKSLWREQYVYTLFVVVLRMHIVGSSKDGILILMYYIE